MSVLNPRNLPSFGQKLGNPPPLFADIICEWPVQAIKKYFLFESHLADVDAECQYDGEEYEDDGGEEDDEEERVLAEEALYRDGLKDGPQVP